MKADSSVKLRASQFHDTYFYDQDIFSWKKADHYFLGVVIYDILRGRRPFPKDDIGGAANYILKGGRPSRPQGNVGKLFVDGIWKVLDLCWDIRRAVTMGDRRSAKDILQHLEQIPSPLRLSHGVDLDMETDPGDVLPVFVGPPESGRRLSSFPGPLLIILVAPTTRLSS